MVKFLCEQIITYYGCPKILSNDRSKYFLNKVKYDLTLKFRTNYIKTISYHSLANGHIEHLNQTLIKILKKTITNFKRD